ncbi:MAG: hypothetical protein PHY30_01710 [Candidatus Pacebacteria bacterium]|nr:hypothetical protein [Candidatus Paceibacterota bacterium]
MYIPVKREDFDVFILHFTDLFGEPKSHYKLERARFVTFIDKKHIDVFLINKESDGLEALSLKTI